LRILLGAVVTLLVVIVAGTAFIVFGHRDPGEKSRDEAVEDFREGGAQQGSGDGSGDTELVRPEAGVYSAEAEGEEDVGFGPLNESFGPEAPVTVTHGDNGCFTTRVDLNANHWRDWTFCITDDGVVESGESTFVTREFPGVSFDILTTFVCDPPLLMLHSGPDTREVSTGSCTGTNDSLEGSTDVQVTVSTVATGSTEIDGEERESVTVERASVLTGFQEGSETIEIVLDKSTGLPLSMTFDTDVATESPLGRRDYRDTGSFTLTSLMPTT